MIKSYISLVCLFFLWSGYSQYSYNGSNKHLFQTNYGNIEIGPMNAGWGHIYTDRPKIIFNKDVYTTTNAFSSYNNDLILKTKGSERLRILDENGNIGIGTTNPRNILQISDAFSFHNGGHEVIGFGWAHGSSGGDLNSLEYSSEIRLDPVNGIFSMGVSTSLTDYPITRLSILKNGNVGINTTNPDAKLTVKGNIHVQEVKVDLGGAIAPDYVFKEDYNLRSLESLKAIIQEKGHLPNIPSAKEMEADGINLKEMNLKLLEKIEELTLYVIDLKREIEILKNK